MFKNLFSYFLFFSAFGLINAQNNSSALRNTPNIIIILADDLGYADVGFNGCEDIPTPNIDKIASQGITFSNAYVSYAVCGPSRAGLITGRYQDRFGFGRNPLFAPNDPNMGLPLTEETLASALKKANYKSVALGKWHLGAHETLWPLRRGFDDFYGFLSGGHEYFPEKWNLSDEFECKAQYDAYRTKLLRNHDRVEEKEYLTDALSREAVNYIEKYKKQPFFIYLAYNAPHTPLQATDEYLNRFPNIKDKKRKTYAAMVSAMDDGVGRVLNKLETLGLTENTIVFFLSDNGGPERHNASNNGVLRDGKSSLFEGGIHVPFAMRWPHKIPSGAVYEPSIISFDIFATAIAQVPSPIKTKNPIDGVNLIPFLTGENTANPHEYLFWRKFDANNFAMRDSTGDKIVFSKGNNMLFNLQEDLSETENLIDIKPESFNDLKRRYDDWKNNMLNPIFLGLNKNKAYNKLHPNRFVKEHNQKQQ